MYPRCKVELNEPIDIMKPIAHKKFYLLLNNNFYWSEAFQSLTKSAQNLLFCMIAELKYIGKRGSKKNPFRYTNNGRISFSETEFFKQGLGASGTYNSAKKQLIKVGLIKITYRGGFARGDMNTYQLLLNSGFGKVGVLGGDFVYAKTFLPKFQWPVGAGEHFEELQKDKYFVNEVFRPKTGKEVKITALECRLNV